MARKQKLTKKERENIAFILKLFSCCLIVVGFLGGCFVFARLFGGGIDDVSPILPAICVLLCITGFFLAMIDRLEFKSSTVIIAASLAAIVFCVVIFFASLIITNIRDRRFVPDSSMVSHKK